jgi:hypothetical protein
MEKLKIINKEMKKGGGKGKEEKKKGKMKKQK